MKKIFSDINIKYHLALILILGLSYSMHVKAMPDMNLALSDVEFITSESSSLKLEKFKGKIILVFFGYTHCPDICPTTLLDITKTLNDLGDDASEVQPVFISVDYQRDNPEHLAQYVKYFDSRILGVSSNKYNIDKISRYFKTQYALLEPEAKNYLVEHSSNLYVIDKNLIVNRIIPNGLPGTEITKAVRKLIP